MLKHPSLTLPIAALALLAWALPAVSSALSAEPEPAVQKLIEKMLTAIEKKDRGSFVEEGNDAVKEGTTEAIMAIMAEKVGSRLKQGYKSQYLCALKQLGHEVHLWKLTFQDEGDDLVVRLVLKEGKVAGFFFQ